MECVEPPDSAGYPGAVLAECREAMVTCRAALRTLRGALVACPERDLSRVAGELAELRALAGAGLVAVTAEAEGRGVVAASQCASTAAWVADVAWYSRREASTVAKAAALLGKSEYAPIAGSLFSCDIDLPSAVVVGSEFSKLAPDLSDAAAPVVLEHLLDVAAEHGPTAVRRLKDEILARYGADGSFEEQCERRRRHIELSAGAQTDGGLWEYQLTVDGEGRAVLEAVIGPGSKPTVDPESSERDLRPMGRRRGEALVEALRRSVTAAGHVPTSPKAVLMVTMKQSDLVARIHAVGAGAALAAAQREDRAGAGATLGNRAAGELLPPGTLRRIACDAGVIPVVLGGRGEVLEQGTMVRPFTRAQVRALWLRDEHCTFPGCDTPAAWCDAHHVKHWADGGPTDLSNAALLCPRHHTIVHRDQLAAHVVNPADAAGTRSSVSSARSPGSGPPRSSGSRMRGAELRRGSPDVVPIDGGRTLSRQVLWDLRPGSYLRALEESRCAA